MPFFQSEVSGNWIAESCVTVGTGDLNLVGPDASFAAFSEAVSIGSYVWYSIADGDNREAGIGLLQSANVLVRSNVKAKLVGGIYSKGDNLPALSLSGSSVVSGTLNASALDELWAHIWKTDNPHATQWDDLIGVPATFPPAPHAHVEADITNLDKYTQSEVDGLLAGKEDDLGNPATNDWVLASNTDGTRFWRAETGGGGGEANTSSNQGAGEGLALPKAGVDLPFKSLVAGANITLTPAADTVTIASSGGGGGEANAGENIGTGQGDVYAGKSLLNLQFKRLAQGSGIGISQTGDTITIENTSGGGGGEANTSSNQGGGVELALPKSVVDLPFRTLTAASARIDISQLATTVSIDVNEGSIVHQNLSGAGLNDHAAIDNHIGNSPTIHFTEASIDHTNIQNVGTRTHPQLESDIAEKVAKAGDTMTGSLTIRTNGSSGATPNPFSDDLIIEGGAADAGGIAFITPNNVGGQLTWGDPENNSSGRILYNHDGDFMRMDVDAVETFRLRRVGGSGVMTIDNGRVAVSDTTDVTGANQVTNMMSLTQSDYDAIGAPDASTLYLITGP